LKLWQTIGVKSRTLEFAGWVSSVREPERIDLTSDLDFVVEFEKKSFDGCMDLKFFLEDLFLCPVDLVIHDAIKLRLRETILKESVYVQGL